MKKILYICCLACLVLSCSDKSISEDRKDIDIITTITEGIVTDWNSTKNDIASRMENFSKCSNSTDDEWHYKSGDGQNTISYRFSSNKLISIMIFDTMMTR